MLAEDLACENVFDCYDFAMINEHGFSTLLNPTIPVTCGQVYHVRIAIADVFDHIYNYAALLKPIGGTSNLGINPSLSVSFESGGEPIYDVYEDCNPVWINIQRSEQIPINEPDTVYLSSSGTTIEGIDFDFLPEYIIIPAGDSTYSFSLGISDDGIAEGLENMIISCSEIHNENQSCEISVSVQVWDSAEPIVAENTDVLMCSTEVLLAPELSGGYGQYSYLWPDGSTGPTYMLTNANETTSAFVVVDDVCSFQPDTIDFDLIFFDPLMVDIQLDSILYTCNTVLTINSNVSGGYGEYQYSWNPFVSMDDTNVYEYNTSLGPQMVYLTVTDECNIGTTDSVMIYTLADPVMIYNGEDTLYTNCNGQVSVTPAISGGFGPYTNFFFIGQNLQVGNSISLIPTDTLLIVVMSYDMCGQILVTPVLVLPVTEPILIDLPNNSNLSCSGITMVQPMVEGGFGNLIYQWWESGEVTSDDDISYEYYGTDPGELIFQVTDECGEFSADTTILILEFSTLELSMADSISVNCLEEVLFDYEVAGGQEPYNYSWIQDGVEISIGSELSDLTFATQETIELHISDACGQEVSDSTEVIVNNIPLEINVNQGLVYCGVSTTLNGEWTGGAGDLSFEWIVNGMVSGTDDYLNYLFTEVSNEVIWFATDLCNQVDSDTVNVQAQVLPLQIELTSELDITCGELVDVQPQIVEGAMDLEYEWYFNGVLQAETPALQGWNPGENGTLIVVVNDVCGSVDSASVDIEVLTLSLSAGLPDTLELDCASVIDLVPDQTTWTNETICSWFYNDVQISDDPSLSVDSWTQGGWVKLVLMDPCDDLFVDSCFVVVKLDSLSGSIGDYYLCEAGTIELSGETDGGNGNLEYFWNNENTEESALVLNTADDMTVEWMVQDQCGQSIIDTSTIYVYSIENEILWLDLGASGLFSVSDTSCLDCTYSWWLNDFSAEGSNIEYSYPASSDFVVMLITEISWCADTTYLYVSPPSSYFIPNSFTPNEDGVNDVFGIESIGLTNVEFTIYNRWGEVVYLTTDPKGRWTGSFMNGTFYCEDGAYVYHLKARNAQTQFIDRTGIVTLFR
jgi:gliding motility-associated-like protein